MLVQEWRSPEALETHVGSRAALDFDRELKDGEMLGSGLAREDLTCIIWYQTMFDIIYCVHCCICLDLYLPRSSLAAE